MNVPLEYKDFCRAWLIVRSDTLDQSALSDATGIPKRKPNSFGRTPKARVVSLHSDRAISEDLPMHDHITWMIAQISKNERLMRFLQNGLGRSELFLYTTSNQEAAYTEITADMLRFFANLGCDLNIKIETECEWKDQSDS